MYLCQATNSILHVDFPALFTEIPRDTKLVGEGKDGALLIDKL